MLGFSINSVNGSIICGYGVCCVNMFMVVISVVSGVNVFSMSIGIVSRYNVDYLFVCMLGVISVVDRYNCNYSRLMFGSWLGNIRNRCCMVGFWRVCWCDS